MRKIEKQMLEAIEKGINWQSGNTTIKWYDGIFPVMRVYLHGNHIATAYQNGDYVEPNCKTLKEWPTPTTCSRLRALGVHVNIIKGVPHIDGKPI